MAPPVLGRACPALAFTRGAMPTEPFNKLYVSLVNAPAPLWGN